MRWRSSSAEVLKGVRPGRAVSEAAYESEARAVAQVVGADGPRAGPLAAATREFQDSVIGSSRRRSTPRHRDDGADDPGDPHRRERRQRAPWKDAPLSEARVAVRKRIKAYRTVRRPRAASPVLALPAGGGSSGADLATKIKLSVRDRRPLRPLDQGLPRRLYICRSPLAFSSARHRRACSRDSAGMRASRAAASPDDVDWRRFQQEYRDYIDLASSPSSFPSSRATAWW